MLHGPNTITVPLTARARTHEALLEHALTRRRGGRPSACLGIRGRRRRRPGRRRHRPATIPVPRKDPDRLDAGLHRVAVRAALRERRRGHLLRDEDSHDVQRPTPSRLPRPLRHPASARRPPRPSALRAARSSASYDLPDAAIARALGVREGAVPLAALARPAMPPPALTEDQNADTDLLESFGAPARSLLAARRAPAPRARVAARRRSRAASGAGDRRLAASRQR